MEHAVGVPVKASFARATDGGNRTGYDICVHDWPKRINVPRQGLDRQGTGSVRATERGCQVNRYGFSIRTKHGQRVDNILIMAATQVDAERRLRQMYHHCIITECASQRVRQRFEGLDVDTVIGLIRAGGSPQQAGTQ